MLKLVTWAVLGLIGNVEPECLSRAGAEATRVCNLVKGRVLGYFIRRGMTAEEVVQILGPPDGCVGSLDGGSTAFYYRYGLVVGYSSRLSPRPDTVEGVGFDR